VQSVPCFCERRAFLFGELFLLGSWLEPYGARWRKKKKENNRKGDQTAM